MESARFVELAQLHASTDYASKQSVARANAAANEMRSIVEAAALQGPAALENILGLLAHPVASQWVAFSALDLASLTEFQTQRCLKVIKLLANGTGPNSLGARAWLKQHGHVT